MDGELTKLAGQISSVPAELVGDSPMTFFLIAYHCFRTFKLRLAYREEKA